MVQCGGGGYIAPKMTNICNVGKNNCFNNLRTRYFVCMKTSPVKENNERFSAIHNASHLELRSVITAQKSHSLAFSASSFPFFSSSSSSK